MPLPENVGAAAAGLAVKLGVSHALDGEHGSDSKKPRVSGAFHQWNTSPGASLPQQNPLCEASPLGLRLRKSSSLLDLIQTRLSHGKSLEHRCDGGGGVDVETKDTKGVHGTADKLKAANFPITLLRIGTWKRSSRHEGDLVAKCYFAKRKLVWEILDGGLKSKIEIQWSDINAIKAACPDTGLSTLDIVVSRQPLFFKESNPQPRKHTSWHPTSDFTGGQASLDRRHSLQIPQGLLGRHFEKLIQCDPRLNALSRQPVILDFPCIESKCSLFGDRDGIKSLGHNHVKAEFGSTFLDLRDSSSTSASKSSSTSGTGDMVRILDTLSQEYHSPSSVMDVSARNTDYELGLDTHEFDDLPQFVPPEILYPSVSLNDLLNNMGEHISEQKTLEDPLLEADNLVDEDILQQTGPALQMNGYNNDGDHFKEMAPNLYKCSTINMKSLFHLETADGGCEYASVYKQSPPPIPKNESVEELLLNLTRQSLFHLETGDEESEYVSACKLPQPSAIPKNESTEELLLNLPRIASLSHIWLNIIDGVENKADELCLENVMIVD